MYVVGSEPLAFGRTESKADFSGIQIPGRWGDWSPALHNAAIRISGRARPKPRSPGREGDSPPIIWPPNGKGRHMAELKI